MPDCSPRSPGSPKVNEAHGAELSGCAGGTPGEPWTHALDGMCELRSTDNAQRGNIHRTEGYVRDVACFLERDRVRSAAYGYAT